MIYFFFLINCWEQLINCWVFNPLKDGCVILNSWTSRFRNESQGLQGLAEGPRGCGGVQGERGGWAVTSVRAIVFPLLPHTGGVLYNIYSAIRKTRIPVLRRSLVLLQGTFVPQYFSKERMLGHTLRKQHLK